MKLRTKEAIRADIIKVINQYLASGKYKSVTERKARKRKAYQVNKLCKELKKTLRYEKETSK